MSRNSDNEEILHKVFASDDSRNIVREYYRQQLSNKTDSYYPVLYWLICIPNDISWILSQLFSYGYQISDDDVCRLMRNGAGRKPDVLKKQLMECARYNQVRSNSLEYYIDLHYKQQYFAPKVQMDLELFGAMCQSALKAGCTLYGHESLIKTMRTNKMDFIADIFQKQLDEYQYAIYVIWKRQCSDIRDDNVFWCFIAKML